MMTPDQQLLIGRLDGMAEWDALTAYLQERREKCMKNILGPTDHETYLQLVGEVRGLDAAMSAPKRPVSANTTRTLGARSA